MTFIFLKSVTSPSELQSIVHKWSEHFFDMDEHFINMSRKNVSKYEIVWATGNSFRELEAHRKKKFFWRSHQKQLFDTKHDFDVCL